MRRVLLVGDGRMGTLLREQLDASDDFTVAGVIGIDNRTDLVDGAAPSVDLVIDFSHPDMVPLLDGFVRRTGAALLSGTTGLDEDGLRTLCALGAVASVTHSSNYSLGIAMLRHLTAQAAQMLADWDIEIVECHHNQKADAPSGTALALLEAIDPDGVRPVVNGRAGMVGARRHGEVGVHALRGGTVAGVHEVRLFGMDEEISLAHRATSRQVFASGALAAARRLIDRPSGFYTFDDLLFGRQPTVRGTASAH